MKAFQLLSGPERRAAALAALVFSVAVLGSAVLLFAADGRAPFVEADSAFAAEMARCQEWRASAERHRCLRQVAALAAVPGASAPARFALR